MNSIRVNNRIIQIVDETWTKKKYNTNIGEIKWKICNCAYMYVYMRIYKFVTMLMVRSFCRFYFCFVCGTLKLLYHSTHQEQRTLVNNKSNRNQNRFYLPITLLALLLIFCPVFSISLSWNCFFFFSVLSRKKNPLKTCMLMGLYYIFWIKKIHHWLHFYTDNEKKNNFVGTKKFMRRNNSFGAIILK